MVTTRALWGALLLLTHLSGTALAGVVFTNEDYYIEAGIPFTIRWADNRGAVTITVTNGPDSDLQPVLVVVADYEGGQEYTWTPPPTLATDSYVLQIADSGSADYSPRIKFTGANVASAVVSSTSSTPFISSTSLSPSPSTLSTSIITTTTTTPSTSSPNSAITTTTLATASSSNNSNSINGTTDPLSTAAKATIITLSVLLFLALLALLLWLAYRRGKRTALLQHQQQQQLDQQRQQFAATAEDNSKDYDRRSRHLQYFANHHRHHYPRHELALDADKEMRVAAPPGRIVELPTGGGSFEMGPGGKHGHDDDDREDYDDEKGADVLEISPGGGLGPAERGFKLRGETRTRGPGDWGGSSLGEGRGPVAELPAAFTTSSPTSFGRTGR